MLAGVVLDDDPKPVKAAACRALDEHTLELTLTEGKYHQVKRMVAAVSNRVEALRQGPSYTWDTLCAYREAEPQSELYFILGSPDFALLSTWHRGLELPKLCHFVVVPRKGHTAGDFMAAACIFAADGDCLSHGDSVFKVMVKE